MNKLIATDQNSIHQAVQNYYGQILSSSTDLKTSACCGASGPHKIVKDIIAKIPSEVNDKFYGCGNPIPLGISEMHVLDLGSGSGRDCYIAAALVGENGSVTGIDMTEQQLKIATDYIQEFAKALGYQPKMSFKCGYIENLEAAGISPGTVDMCISNCVVNLSPAKDLVLNGVYTALAYGGEMHFADVYADRRLPISVQRHPVLLGECIGGALYIEDFRRLSNKVGFVGPRNIQISPLEVEDPQLQSLVGDAKFYSIVYRLFKLSANDEIEDREENYGQTVEYLGTIVGNEGEYKFDDSNTFIKGKPTPVSGNVAAILKYSWLHKHFQVLGDRSIHYGLFGSSTIVSNDDKNNTQPCCSQTSERKGNSEVLLSQTSKSSGCCGSTAL